MKITKENVKEECKKMKGIEVIIDFEEPENCFIADCNFEKGLTIVNDNQVEKFCLNRKNETLEVTNSISNENFDLMFIDFLNKINIEGVITNEIDNEITRKYCPSYRKESPGILTCAFK